MILSYEAKQTFNQELQIDDPGHVALRGSTDDGLEYYFATYPDSGKVAILSFGPVIPDFKALPEQFTIDQKIKKYSTKTVAGEINRFANNFKTDITSIEIISEQELLAAMPTPDMYLKPITAFEE